MAEKPTPRLKRFGEYLQGVLVQETDDTMGLMNGVIDIASSGIWLIDSGHVKYSEGVFDRVMKSLQRDKCPHQYLKEMPLVPSLASTAGRRSYQRKGKAAEEMR